MSDRIAYSYITRKIANGNRTYLHDELAWSHRIFIDDIRCARLLRQGKLDEDITLGQLEAADIFSSVYVGR